MLLIELLFRWLLTKLSPTATDGFPVDPPMGHALVLRPHPAPAASSALRRDARWARFNRPPQRLAPRR